MAPRPCGLAWGRLHPPGAGRYAVRFWRDARAARGRILKSARRLALTSETGVGDRRLRKKDANAHLEDRLPLPATASLRKPPNRDAEGRRPRARETYGFIVVLHALAHTALLKAWTLLRLSVNRHR